MKQRCSAAFVGFGALTPSLRQVVPSGLLIVAAGARGHVLAFRGKSDEFVGGIHGLVGFCCGLQRARLWLGPLTK
jgi:hypothetical protein